jgi:hypothetical protein
MRHLPLNTVLWRNEVVIHGLILALQSGEIPAAQQSRSKAILVSEVDAKPDASKPVRANEGTVGGRVTLKAKSVASPEK